jgi:hypothetical protein
MTVDEIEDNHNKNLKECLNRMSLKDVDHIINILLWEQERMSRDGKNLSKQVLRNILNYSSEGDLQCMS